MYSKQRLNAPAPTLLFSLALSFTPALHAGDGPAGVLELVADGLDQPSNLASPADGRERIYVIDYHVAEIQVIDDGRRSSSI